MVKKYSDLYLDARKALLPVEGQYAANIAREMLTAASGKSTEEMLADREKYAAETVCQKMEEFVQRRLQGEPIAYIIGQWDFYGMTLTVTPDVLIPRDDTVAVTELAIKKALFLPQNPRILDLCTGSGCIGLAIARRVKDARVTLADVSSAALRVAKKNAADLQLGGRVACVQADANKPASAFLGKFDLIVANPPYINRQDMEHLDPSVKNFEPHLALYGGEDGLDVYRAILTNFTLALRPEGAICFEFGMGQENGVCSLLQQHKYTILELKEDYAGTIRAVLAQKRREER